MDVRLDKPAAALLFALLLTLSAPAADAFGLAGSADRKRQREQEAQIKRNDAATDQAIADALASGKSLVVMPAIDVLKRQHVDELGSASAPMSTYDFSMTVRWVKADDPNKILRAGLLDVGERAKLRGVRRSESGATEFVPILPAYEGWGKGRYQIYVVDPGTYQIDGADALVRRTSLPAKEGKPLLPEASVGVLEMTQRPHQELEKYQEWRDAQ